MISATQFDVVGLGVSVLDIAQLAEHFQVQEEVQRAEDGLVQGGGPVATAMVALARSGARVAMLDVLGDDWRRARVSAGDEATGSPDRRLHRRSGFCRQVQRGRPGLKRSLRCFWKRARGRELKETASFASGVAASNSQRLGGRARLPNLKQVTAFFAKISGG